MSRNENQKEHSGSPGRGPIGEGNSQAKETQSCLEV